MAFLCFLFLLSLAEQVHSATYAKVSISYLLPGGATVQKQLSDVAYYSLFGNTTAFSGKMVPLLDSSSRLMYACSPFKVAGIDLSEGWVAVVSRDKCKFTEKSLNIAAAGATAFILIDTSDDEDEPPLMSAVEGAKYSLIPGVSIGSENGDVLLKAYQASGKKVEISVTPNGVFNIERDQPVVVNWFITHLLIFGGILGTLVIAFVVITIYRRRHQRAMMPPPVIEPEKLLATIPLRVFEDTADSSRYGPTCAICLDDFENGVELRILKCNHEFHATCFDPWIHLGNRNCPLCKADVTADPPPRGTFAVPAAASNLNQVHESSLSSNNFNTTEESSSALNPAYDPGNEDMSEEKVVLEVQHLSPSLATPRDDESYIELTNYDLPLESLRVSNDYSSDI